MEEAQRDALEKIRAGALLIVDGLERLLETPQRTAELRNEYKELRQRVRELERELVQTEGGA